MTTRRSIAWLFGVCWLLVSCADRERDPFRHPKVVDMTDHEAFSWIAGKCIASDRWTYVDKGIGSLNDNLPPGFPPIYGEMMPAGDYGTPVDHSEYEKGMPTATSSLQAAYPPFTPHNIVAVLRHNAIDGIDYVYIAEVIVDDKPALVSAYPLFPREIWRARALELGAALAPGEGLFIDGVGYCEDAVESDATESDSETISRVVSPPTADRPDS